MSYYPKYLKYKTKYISLKNLMGGVSGSNAPPITHITQPITPPITQPITDITQPLPTLIPLNSSITPTLQQHPFLGDHPMVVNLMWFYNDVNNNKYVYPEFHKDLNITEKINGWIDKGFIVYLWINKSTVNDLQIINTQQEFLQHHNFEIKLVDDNILRGFDDINTCKLYTRLDFIRLLILKQFAELEFKFEYYIYSDIVVSPITKGRLLLNQNLEAYKLVLSNTIQGDTAVGSYENSFIGIKNDVSINNNLIQFVNKMYEIIVKNKKIKQTEEKSCSAFAEKEVEVFYNTIIILIYIQINTLYHTNESNDIEALFYNRNLSNKFSLKSTDAEIANAFKQVPYINKPFLSKGSDPAKLLTHNYVYPVINIERPPSNKSYDTSH